MPSLIGREAGRFLARTFIAAAGMILAAGMALAQQSTVNSGPDGVAVDGFDVVAYFTEGAPRKGVADHSTSYLGKEWRFATAEHAALFAADPARYAPQSNGYCSYAVSEGYAAEVDFIDGWAILDGKLYLNWNSEVRDTFVAEKAERVPKAAGNWPGVQAGLLDGTVEFYPHSSDPSVGISHPQQLD